MQKLSIIVPVYNVVSYLTECVDSLLAQSYRNCEIIIVDDGSTDGSSSLCDDLALTDDRIQVVHKQNGGLSSARNAGLRVAKGCYISFIDSDDLVAPNMFSVLINALDSHNASVAICNFEVFNKRDRYRGTRYKDAVIDYSEENQVEFYRAALDSSCNRVFRADAIRDNQIEFVHKDVVAQEDYWFQVRLFSHFTRIVTISDSLYFYRERGSSITKSHSDGDITDRNLHFYTQANDYIRSMSQRNVEDFKKYLFMNLFTSSVNNASEASKQVIETIVKQFSRMGDFREAVAFERKGIRHKMDVRVLYNAFTLWLLSHRHDGLYSFFEALRIRKLRSNNRTELYYQ